MNYKWTINIFISLLKIIVEDFSNNNWLLQTEISSQRVSSFIKRFSYDLSSREDTKN